VDKAETDGIAAKKRKMLKMKLRKDRKDFQDEKPWRRLGLYKIFALFALFRGYFLVVYPAALSLWLLLTVAAGGRLQAQAPPGVFLTNVNPDAAGGRLPPQAPPDLKTPQPSKPQIPPDYQTKILLMKGKVLEYLLSGDKRTPVAERDDLITPFMLKSFGGGPSNEVRLVGRAPESHVDKDGHRAWDAGPIVLFTPTTNVWVQGAGFLFVETNHLLTISNKVETLVLKSLLKTSTPSGAKTNAPETEGQRVKIFADGPALFDYVSNFAQYFHHVHAIDAQLDLTSEKLTIQMTTNSTIQTILAEDNVVLTTTNKGRATGPRAFYYLTNGGEMTELTGGAVWHNGDEMARAEKFIYDSTNHLLTAIGHVRVWWPNGPQQPGVPPKTNESGYRELWAEFATLRWPPTNGPVEEMHATGYVLIVNQADGSGSISDHADYVRTNDSFELTGSPKWWNTNLEMEITGLTLTAEITNKINHAHGDAHMKRKVGGPTHTNEWLYIASDDLVDYTNLALFAGHVHSRLFEDDVLRDTLNSDKLDVEMMSNTVKTAIARGHVEGETAPDKLGRIDTIACETLTAHNNPATKMLTDIVAENHVVLRHFGTNTADPRSRLTSVMATAYFSTVLTNKMERAVAERDVVIDHVKTNQTIHATGQRADYAVEPDEVKLTGAPVARDDQHVIAETDYMIWQPKTNRLRGYGPYLMDPVRVLTNPPSSKP
jgi:lipopolysaccharide export system protein LptA